MSSLPTYVVCCACRQRTHINSTRRLITLWARPGAGGSLSGIKDQHAEDTYRCDTCVREGRFKPEDERQETLI